MEPRLDADKTGISLSALCVIHCLTGPILLAVAPNFHHFADETLFHSLLGPFLVGIAAFALLRGYRHHRRAPILLLGLIGVGFLTAGVMAPHEESVGFYSKQAVLSLIGSGLLISAHLWNLRSCRACPGTHG